MTLYHFTTSAHLPRIIRSGALRVPTYTLCPGAGFYLGNVRSERGAHRVGRDRIMGEGISRRRFVPRPIDP